jgi:hypothetical protein
VRRALVGACAVAALLVLGVGTASAQQFHGIAFTKGCQPNTAIGQPLTCAFQILNLVDGGQDTLQISNVTDVVNSAGGAVNSGNILGSLQLVFSSPTVSCTGGGGAGTNASPYVGATQCTLPFGTSIQTNGFSHYTVQPGDFALPNHSLTDSATLGWNNTCTSPTVQNCTTGPQQASAGSSTTVQQIPSSTATAIRNAAGGTVTAVAVGTTVHDFVTVTGAGGLPQPSGNVNIDWFTNGTCTAPLAVNSGSIGPLVPDGGADSNFDATGFSFTVNNPGQFAFRAHYEGDGTYLPSDGPCEPLQVVDANIQITPQQATNPINSNHTLTGHVNVNDGLGGGYVSAPDGTVITFTKVSGPGDFVPAGANTCMTTGGTGSCTVVISSTTTGTTVVNASSTVSVGGVSLTRSTGDGLPGDSPNANKTWVAAFISIAPSATNEVGHAHVFTVTVVQDPGTGVLQLAPNVPVAVTCVAANGAAAQGPFNGTTNASGTFLVTVNSPTTGTLTCHAVGTVTLGNPPTTFTVETNGVAPNSGDATKTWVDASIQIIPLQATNTIGTSHILTGHVSVDTGNGAGLVPAPDGTVITFTLSNSNGATAVFQGPSSCTTAGGTGSCAVLISSPTAGNTSIHATTTVDVGGVLLTRATGDGHPGDSPDANKLWIAPSANIQISPLTASNEIGTNHTLTGHVNVSPDGVTFSNAPDGTVINFTLTNAAGATAAFVGPSSCTTAGGTGSCTVVISSPSPGNTTIHATSDLTVNGVPLHVETNGVAPNSGDATKNWVDANIQVTPAQATNTIGTNHTLTGHVNVNDGSGAGFVNAPDGTVITFTLSNSNGATAAFVGPSSCTTAGGTGSCTVVISSPTAGNTSIHASSTVAVNGVSLTRATGDAHAGDSTDANKLWIAPSANIQISPLTASNEIGTNHTLTGHVNVSPDGVTFSNAPAGTVINFTLTNAAGATAAFVGPSSCTTVGGTGSCTVVISSPTPGNTTVHATSDVTVNGVPLHVETNGVAPNSGDAHKNWVDANIQITPANATNPVNTNHTLTGHVNVNDGSGAGFVNAPAGTTITFALSNAGGASAAFVGPSSCTTVGATGSCTVVISSPTAGTTTINASSTVSVSGVSLTRTTNGVGASSGPATKIWINPDANIQISPQTATNPVGTNHTLTGHVNVAPDGVNFVNAPAGTVITFSLTNAGGATATFVGPSSCTTAGATGSCTVVISSPTAGTTTVNASTTVTVSGVSLTRTTSGSAGNSGPATKVWLASVVTTRVRDASNNDVTNSTVPTGTVVHDEATVAGSAAGNPTPTGTVTFTLFASGNCAGTVQATDPNKPLNAAGLATSVTFTTPSSGGQFSYLAHYSGDANYPAADGPCEPFMVSQAQGRVTGGGSIFWTVNGVPNTRITHGEELRCDPTDPRQSLEINWSGANGQNNFHLDKLINSVICFNDPLVAPPPPPGTVFDTYAGNTLFQGHTGYHGFGYAVGTGTCNKLPATIYFIFSDAGEPGTGDVAEYHIVGGCTLNVGPALIDRGNVQFHKS